MGQEIDAAEVLVELSSSLKRYEQRRSANIPMDRNDKAATWLDRAGNILLIITAIAFAADVILYLKDAVFVPASSYNRYETLQSWPGSVARWYLEDDAARFHFNETTSLFDILGMIFWAGFFLLKSAIYIVWDCFFLPIFYTFGVPIYLSAAFYGLAGVACHASSVALLYAKDRGVTLPMGFGAEPTFDPMNRAGKEDPLGEAAFARLPDVSAALEGKSAQTAAPPPLFED
jgi:hypothetical protein